MYVFIFYLNPNVDFHLHLCRQHNGNKTFLKTLSFIVSFGQASKRVSQSRSASQSTTNYFKDAEIPSYFFFQK